jgi:hypothetical protein
MVIEEDRRLKPIINASYPGTLTALSLTVLQITGNENYFLRFNLTFNALFFLLSAFFIFFFTIYRKRTWLWTCTAVTFILGLVGSLTSIAILFFNIS